MQALPLGLWRMPRAHYDRLIEAGILGPEDRVELLDGLLYREPVAAPEPPGEWTYAAVQVLRRRARVAPLAAPGARVRIASLLP